MSEIATLLAEAAPRNLLGDRHIEWSWVAANIPDGPGAVLEFGPGDSWLGWVAVHQGHQVTAVDLMPVTWPYVEPNLRFIQGDLLDIDLPPASFDVVLNCSAIEHTGLAGRYGVVNDDPDGDLITMKHLHHLMKPNAPMILTIPVGLDAVFRPMTRVYGQERLPRLLSGFTIQREAYWAKDDENRWVREDRAQALAFEASAGDTDWRQNVYALGCFVLAKL